MRTPLTGLDRQRLRLGLALFFLALALPTALLVRHAYSQLKWESFHQHQTLAAELSSRIDGKLRQLVDAEEARSFSDYSFLVVAGDPAANFVQRSPLSEFPLKPAIPGLLGYFQVNALGIFSSPALPEPVADGAKFGISADEWQRRADLQNRVLAILSENRLVHEPVKAAVPEASPARITAKPGSVEEAKTAQEKVAPQKKTAQLEAANASTATAQSSAGSQAAFDQLSETAPAAADKKMKQESTGILGKVADLKLRSRADQDMATKNDAASPTTNQLAKRLGRKEFSALPESYAPEAVGRRIVPASPQVRVSTFESEIDPFEFSRLESGHFVLFRKVWREGQRFIQGAIIEPDALLRGVIQASFQETALLHMSTLMVAYRGDVLAAFGGASPSGYSSRAMDMQGELLQRARLSAPFGEMELIYSVEHMPAGPGGALLNWLSLILASVLCGGFFLMYRLGARQIELTRQQQDFVAAVSHELKTPLTSIRMYGEMLREGWVTEEKKKSYYDFIFMESERLSRLIANVLQLARITRNGAELELKPITVAVLMDGIRSKIATQVASAGFQLNLSFPPEIADLPVRVDEDAFTQIIINLVDNALKFSAKAELKAVDIRCSKQRDGSVVFSVRDYGPGIPRHQLKKIFRLFYRLENELTRETVGTGIGLALVHQLALGMNAKVDVVNREPGVEFAMRFDASAQ